MAEFNIGDEVHVGKGPLTWKIVAISGSKVTLYSRWSTRPRGQWTVDLSKLQHAKPSVPEPTPSPTASNPAHVYRLGTNRWFESNEGGLWDDLTGGIEPATYDPMGQALYHGAYYDKDILTPERIGFRDALEQYMWDEYGIDFAAEFDWEGWREAMGYDAV